MGRWLLICVCVGALAFSAAGAAPVGAAPPPITTFTLPDIFTFNAPEFITAGPDGNIWFTELLANKIAKSTPAGVITEFTLPSPPGFLPSRFPYGITTGPDGNLWFAENATNTIGKITPDGVITEYTTGITPGSGVFTITAGPDGNLWFTENGFAGNKIGMITPSGDVTEYAVPSANSQPYWITAGPDGNLWFTENNNSPAGNKIGRMTTAGDVTEFPVPSGNSRPLGIAAGPDGNLWFTENASQNPPFSDGNKIGRMTTAGVVTEYPIPSAFSSPGGIVAGPDGNLWFTEQNTNQIGQVTTAGVVSEYGSPGQLFGPFGITQGPDGFLWFTMPSFNRIGMARVARPVPTITSLSPATVTPATGAFTLTITGSGFNLASTVKLGSTTYTPAQITVKDYTHLSIIVPASVSATPGTLPVTVTNPAPGGGSASANFVVLNTAPTLDQPTNVTVLEDAGQRTVSLTGIGQGGTDIGEILTVTATSDTPGVIPNPTVTYTSPNPTASLSFTPVPNANTPTTPVTISVAVKDNGGTGGGGQDTVVKTFTVMVLPVNDAPSYTKGPDVTVYANSDPYSQPWAGDVSPGPPAESDQSVQFHIRGNSNPALFAVQPTLSSTGVLSFTPAPNVLGSAVITITLEDNGGVNNGGIDSTAPQSFVITVAATSPVATADSYVVTAGIPVTITAPGVLLNDTGAVPITARKASDPAHGTVTVNADGSFTYTASSTFTGTDAFTYTATNSSGTSAVTTVTIRVVAAPLVSIAVTPVSPTLHVGEVQRFRATGTYANGMTVDLTNQVQWTSAAASIAQVRPDGMVTAQAAGTATIIVTQGTITGQTSVTVSGPAGNAPAPSNRPAGASSEPSPAPAPAPTGR